MASIGPSGGFLQRLRCCPPPPQVSNLTATTGGGSGEVVVTWDPLAPADVAFYRVYQKKGTGTWWHLAVVTPEALGEIAPGRLGIVDAADLWPWPTGGVAPGPRCYVVTAMSKKGLEGPFGPPACGSPVGG